MRPSGAEGARALLSSEEQAGVAAQGSERPAGCRGSGRGPGQAGPLQAFAAALSSHGIAVMPSLSFLPLRELLAGGDGASFIVTSSETWTAQGRRVSADGWVPPCRLCLWEGAGWSPEPSWPLVLRAWHASHFSRLWGAGRVLTDRSLDALNLCHTQDWALLSAGPGELTGKDPFPLHVILVGAGTT